MAVVQVGYYWLLWLWRGGVGEVVGGGGVAVGLLVQQVAKGERLGLELVGRVVCELARFLDLVFGAVGGLRVVG